MVSWNEADLAQLNKNPDYWLRKAGAPDGVVVGATSGSPFTVNIFNAADNTQTVSIRVKDYSGAVVQADVILGLGSMKSVTRTYDLAYSLQWTIEVSIDGGAHWRKVYKYPVPGTEDINIDGSDDGMDLGELGMSWLNSGGYVAKRDINRDGMIDGMDLGTLGMYWLLSDP
jgi:hypothetical protein